MKRSLFVLSAATAIVAGSVLATAQNPPAGAPAQGGGRGPTAPMTFFVTSVGSGNGANYGGLAGAEARSGYARDRLALTTHRLFQV